MSEHSGGRLLDHLPAIYHTSVDLRRLLDGLEQYLIGPDAEGEPGLHQRLDSVPDLFAPAGREASTPSEFLPWLASWFAMDEFAGLGEPQVRAMIPTIVELYRWRGTARYLEGLLELFVSGRAEVEIVDEPPSFRIGQSRLGRDTRLAGERPYWFGLRVRIPPEVEASEHGRLLDTITRIADLARPAHTEFEVVSVGPTGPDATAFDREEVNHDGD